MYSPKVDEEQVEKLYHLREELAQKGVRKPITVLVREAVEEYLEKRKEVNNSQE